VEFWIQGVTMQYDHTQTAPLHLFLVGVGITVLISGWLAPELVVQIILICSGLLMFLLALVSPTDGHPQSKVELSNHSTVSSGSI
jgi:hypothetical protein